MCTSIWWSLLLLVLLPPPLPPVRDTGSGQGHRHTTRDLSPALSSMLTLVAAIISEFLRLFDCIKSFCRRSNNANMQTIIITKAMCTTKCKTFSEHLRKCAAAAVSVFHFAAGFTPFELTGLIMFDSHRLSASQRANLTVPQIYSLIQRAQ